MGFIARVREHVVDDRPVHVPSDQIDGGERRHGATGVWPDQRVHEGHAVLAGELRHLVQHLEAHPVARERRQIGRAHDLAPESLLEQSHDEIDKRRIRFGVRDHLAAGDHVRRVEEMDAEKALAEAIAAALGHRRNRQPRRNRGDDRVGATVLVHLGRSWS